MGRVFFGVRKNIRKLTADYTCLESDSGSIFLVNPAATTAVTLPTISTSIDGWNCKIMVTEDAAATAGSMGGIVNVDFGSGSLVIGQIGASSNVAGDLAVSGDDFVNFTAAATPGDYIDVFTDGVNWYVSGMATDSTAGTGDVLFHTAAAS